MKKMLVLFAAALLSWNTAYAAPPEATGIIRVGEVSGKWISAGFVADDKGHVIARAKASSKPLLVNTIEGTEYMANTVAHDRVSGLSLLKITGDITALKPYKVARNPAEPQRRVFGVKVHEDLSQSEVVGGTLASIQEQETDALTGYYLHNALVGEMGTGGPLLNNCGEVVGIIVPQPKFLARLLARDEERTSYAVPIEWLISQFGVQSLQPQRVADPCLSEAAQAAATQAKLEEESRRATEAAEATATAQAELDAVKNQLEEAQGASEEERLRLEAEIAARQGAVNEAQAREIEASEALTTTREALDEAQARGIEASEALEAAHRASEERKEQYKTWGILGGGSLLLLLLLVWAVKQRAVARERREKVVAKSLAEEAQASLAAREQDEERIRRTPTIFFEGADSARQTVTLRIPGASIAATGGVVVGRSPSDSDFVINHPEVSRRQFRLFADGDSLMVEDLGSTNGTKVDGKNLAAGQKNVLADKSQVELSDLSLSVRLERED